MPLASVTVSEYLQSLSSPRVRAPEWHGPRTVPRQGCDSYPKGNDVDDVMRFSTGPPRRDWLLSFVCIPAFKRNESKTGRHLPCRASDAREAAGTRLPKV